MKKITDLSLKDTALAKEISHNFWEYQIWDYASTMPERAKIQSEFLADLFIPHLNNSMILGELACSNGLYTREIAPFVKKIEAFELSQIMIDIAKIETEKSGINNIDYYQANAEDVIFTTEYDSFICLGLFTCMIDTSKIIPIINNIYNTMKKDGFLVIKDTVYVGEGEDKILITETYAAIYRNEDNYCSIFIEAGFKLITKKYISLPDEKENIGSVFLLFQK